jgi:NAD(P)-dependent dehydrogenase (short-subunit alcohol dehydrogenase family)
MTPQHKINSGFDARSTATDVLRGIDLTGKVAIVTGGYSGLGLETTRALAAAGATVVAVGRRPDVARRALGDLDRVEVDELRLDDLTSVREFADRFLATGRKLDMVIANAGIMACPLTRVGPGWEAQFAINHLGHYVLVNLLWPALRGNDARVISVSSAGHHYSGMRWQDVHFERDYDKWVAYGQAKTANALFAVHLDRLGADSGVRAFSLHPGAILTPLQRHLPDAEMVSLGWIDEAGQPADSSFKSPAQGAATQVWAATSPQLAGMGGVYCEDCDIAEPGVAGREPLVGVCDHATDPEQAARLWSLSAELTGIDLVGS